MKPGTKVVREAKFPLQPWLNQRHIGVVLAVNDPEAWVGSIAFGLAMPTLAQTTAHVKRVGGMHGKTPVRWSFGHVYWEDTASLKRLRRVPGTVCGREAA